MNLPEPSIEETNPDSGWDEDEAADRGWENERDERNKNEHHP